MEKPRSKALYKQQMFLRECVENANAHGLSWGPENFRRVDGGIISTLLKKSVTIIAVFIQFLHHMTNEFNPILFRSSLGV